MNQIAAGEVVERPASVVKELVENAIDAGATRVSVRIEGGGRDLIEVADDGAGIPMEELALAVTAHATSKIRSSDDLAQIATLGFRGEALASIGSVARLEIVSRPREQSEAGRVEVDGGRLTGPMPASGAPGTTVRVSTLFGHVPARRKFLRSEAAETGRITELIETMALAHPTVAFRLDNGDRRVIDLASSPDRRTRVNELLGSQLEPDLLEVDAVAGAVGAAVDAGSARSRGAAVAIAAGSGAIAVWGVVARPSAAKATGRHQRIYVNGRAIADRSLLHAIKEAFRGVIDPARYPVAVLQIEIDPTEVDVNVHPAKSEVRFRQPSAVHAFLLRAVRASLRAADLVPMFTLDAAPGGAVEGGGSTATTLPGGQRAVDGRGMSPGGGGASWLRSQPGRPQRGFDYATLHAALARPDHAPPFVPSAMEDRRGAGPERGETPSDDADELPPLPTLLRAGAVLQVHQSYLVTEDAEGIVLIDQHALHERVLYEQLFERVMRGGLERQMLLAPIIIETGPRGAERVEQLGALLGRLGFEATPAGPRSVAVHAVPSFLASRSVDAGAFLAELLDRDDLDPGETGHAGEQARSASEAAIHAVIDMMACKAAVKAGERLTPEEIARLLGERERIERSTNCPHGRPTSLRIPLREIERRFGRS